MITSRSFFDLTDFPHQELFPAEEPVWTGLNHLKQYMNDTDYTIFESYRLADGIPLTRTLVLYKGEAVNASPFKIIFGDATKGKLEVWRGNRHLKGASVVMAGAIFMGKDVQIGKGVLIEGGATIKSPAIIGDYTEVRQGAYLRGYCLTGQRCVLGHATEVKHSIFLNDAKAGHFAYLGDSVLGTNVNLGAGTKLANLRFLSGNVSIMVDGKSMDTGRRKFGAIFGDDAQTGCNSVTNPGTLIGKQGILMPNTTAPSGLHKPRKIIR